MAGLCPGCRLGAQAHAARCLVSAQVGVRAQLISRIMAEPDLAAALQKPKVMQAIMEAQQNPMAMAKYQDDPDVKMVRAAQKRKYNTRFAALQGDFVCSWQEVPMLPMCASGTPAEPMNVCRPLSKVGANNKLCQSWQKVSCAHQAHVPGDPFSAQQPFCLIPALAQNSPCAPHK